MIPSKKAVLDAYHQEYSVKAAARKLGISEATTLKLLCSFGVYPTPRAREIYRIVAGGTSWDDLPALLHMSPEALEKYKPYMRGTYVTAQKSENAKKIAASRARRKGTDKDAD